MKGNKRKFVETVVQEVNPSDDENQSNALNSESMDSSDGHHFDDSDSGGSDGTGNESNAEEDNGIEDNTTDGAKVVNKRVKRKDRRSKTKTLSAQEMNSLVETQTQSAFDCSLFRLQLNEMLTEVKVRERHFNSMDEWLKQFEELLLSLKRGKTYELTDQLWCTTVKVPLIQEPFSVNGKFCFEAPKVCKVVGSYDLGTAIGPKAVVEMAVQIPTTCWQRHDNLNHKYLRKRALYLCHISQEIKCNELVDGMAFTYFNGNHMKPILMIAPKGKAGKHFRLALTAYPEHDQKVFRLNRFIPEMNNIRSDWLQMSDCADLPTPIYNSIIQNDLNLISNHEYLSKTVKYCPQLKDSLILLEIWLKQRELKTEFNFILSLFVCHLLDRHKLNQTSSAFQIFRNTLLSIADSKWDSDGITLTEDVDQSLDYYLTYFAVVFLDITGSHNLCWDITIDLYQRLRHESRITIDCLDSDLKNSFDTTFMKPIPFEMKFDSLLKVSVQSLLKSSKVKDISNDIIDYCGDTVSAFIGHLIPLCRRILGKRVSLIQHKSKAHNNIEWSLDQLPPHPNDALFLTIGLLIDSEHAYNNIERGPAADSPEAKAFKDFWGEKSELRRFQDNSICEAVYWDSKCLSEKRKIISRSLDFILTTILEIPNGSVFTTTSLLDPILELQNLKFENKDIVYGTGEEMSISISHKLDSLAKKLRALEGLPLTITNVQGIDPIFRATEVFPPVAMNCGKTTHFVNNCNIFDVLVDQRVPKYFNPLKVIIHLEGSGKWPEGLDAFYRVKASFNLEICLKLSTQFGLKCYAKPEFVDVLDNGFIFRIIIGSHKELVLLRQLTTPEGLVKQIHSEVADDLETKLEVLPKINSALSALSRTHLCYGVTSRLAKRWISSQLLTHYLDDMAIDLMVAYLFLNPTPYTIPNCPTTGFLRFLSLICDQNWKISALIVNFNNELNDEMLNQMNKKFMNERPKYPPMFVTCSYDKQLSKWTRDRPSAVVLNRLQTLAKAAKQTLISQMNDPLNCDPKLLFRPDLDVYDLMIGLKSDQITNQIQSIDFPLKFELLAKDFDPKLNERIPITDFHPIHRLVQQLRDNYSEFALFFYDHFGGREIGVLWKPSVFETKPLRISSLNGVVLSSTADEKGVQNVNLNIEAIIEDFRVLGEGIITDIDVRTHNWNK